MIWARCCSSISQVWWKLYSDVKMPSTVSKECTRSGCVSVAGLLCTCVLYTVHCDGLWYGMSRTCLSHEYMAQVGRCILCLSHVGVACTQGITLLLLGDYQVVDIHADIQKGYVLEICHGQWSKDSVRFTICANHPRALSILLAPHLFQNLLGETRNRLIAR